MAAGDLLGTGAASAGVRRRQFEYAVRTVCAENPEIGEQTVGVRQTRDGGQDKAAAREGEEGVGRSGQRRNGDRPARSVRRGRKGVRENLKRVVHRFGAYYIIFRSVAAIPDG